MNFEQLRALTAVVDEGTLEAAADLLGIGPSAVSQRVKAPETSVGQVVVGRGMPTEAGDRAAAHYPSGAGPRGGGPPGPGRRDHLPGGDPVAVSADSLATWCVPVPANGRRAESLGGMRDIPVATPALHHRRSTGSGPDGAGMPVLPFDGKDDPQRQTLRSRGIDRSPPTHTIPSSDGVLAAVRAGLGRGMVPEIQLAADLADGTPVVLDHRAHHDVALHRPTWTVPSQRLARLTAASVEPAGTACVPGLASRRRRGRRDRRRPVPRAEHGARGAPADLATWSEDPDGPPAPHRLFLHRAPPHPGVAPPGARSPASSATTCAYEAETRR